MTEIVWLPRYRINWIDLFYNYIIWFVQESDSDDGQFEQQHVRYWCTGGTDMEENSEENEDESDDVIGEKSDSDDGRMGK